jgi:hypothetical protein
MSKPQSAPQDPVAGERMAWVRPWPLFRRHDAMA